MPEPGFEPSEKLLAYLATHGTSITVMPIITDMQHLIQIIPTIDVIYITRIQKERLDANRQNINYQTLKWTLTPGLLSYCKQDMIILHPLPRNEELSESVDNDKRALYFKQMEYGLYLRMALVDLMFSRK